MFAIFNFQRRALVNFDVTFPKGVDWNLALNTADARYYNMATVFHEEDQGPGAFTPIESPQAGSTGTLLGRNRRTSS